MISNTLAYLFSTRTISTMAFSGATTTASIYLNGPGGTPGNGFPLPKRGYLVGIQVWDGTTLRSDTDSISFQAGDKIAVFCQNAGSNFSVKVRLNGTSTALEATAVPFNSTLFVVLEFILIRE
jgi:hypothetical protein